MTVEQILALVEQYGQARVDLVATGDDTADETLAQIDAAVTALANLEQAARDELIQLWGDMTQARRDAHNGGWSVQCENLANRVAALSRLVGATPWGEVDVAVLKEGVYERVHQEAGIDHPPIDWHRVEEVHRYIQEGAKR